MNKYDIIVIGSGPGGFEACLKARSYNASVLLVEKESLGGTCTNKGCIPTKSLLHCAKAYASAIDSQALGLEVEKASFNLQLAMQWKTQAVSSLQSGIQLQLKNAGVDVVFGQAQCLDSTHVKVDDITYESTFLILANGSQPSRPPIPGSDKPLVVTSDEILNLERLPQSLAIIGGGVIGIEFASFFSLLGIKVSVVEMQEEILPMCDGEYSKLIRRALKDVSFYLGCKVDQIDERGLSFINQKGQSLRVDADLVLMSIGRKAVTEGLEALGLETQRSFVVTDDHMATKLKNVYAIGDLNGKSLLAHSASHMADVAINNALGDKTMSFDGSSIPWALYSSIEASGCGVTETQLQKENIAYLKGSVPMRSNPRVVAEWGKRAIGSAKLLCSMDGTIIGFHMVGPYSTELIWGAAVLIQNKVKVDQLKSCVIAHPTVSEIILDCAKALK